MRRDGDGRAPAVDGIPDSATSTGCSDPSLCNRAAAVVGGDVARGSTPGARLGALEDGGINGFQG